MINDVGKKLLDYVLETAKKDSTIIEVYLHVQVHDTSAPCTSCHILIITQGASFVHRRLPNKYKFPCFLQTSNDDAKQFYLANGFISTEIIKDYYKRIEPPDCFLLRKSMKEGYEILQTSSASKEASADVEH